MFKKMHPDDFLIIVFGVIFFIFFALIIATAEAEPKSKTVTKKYTDVCIDGVTYLEYNPVNTSVGSLSPKYNADGTLQTCGIE